MLFLWVKVLHIVAMTAWFAGLFYLPRLFVYHAMTEEVEGQKRFTLMQRKLINVIMTPAATVTIISGGTMIYLLPAYMSMPWMHAKLVCVLILLMYHIQCYRFVDAFQKNQNIRSHRFYRFFNEMPTLLLVLIVILVVVKPF
jgi:protoporphyrinogen IX oxidase